MRIFLLRILIAWWLIPFSYIFTFPIVWLLSGDYKQAKEDVEDLVRACWYGV